MYRLRFDTFCVQNLMIPA